MRTRLAYKEGFMTAFFEFLFVLALVAPTIVLIASVITVGMSFLSRRPTEPQLRPHHAGSR